MINSIFLSISSVNTLLSILKITNAERDVALAVPQISLETPPPPSPTRDYQYFSGT